jgi:hypothetical protein
MPATCPNCGTRKIRTSKTRTLRELFGTLFGVYPLRCLRCDTRFKKKVWRFSEIVYARCPRCYRLDLATWEERLYTPPWKVKLLLRLGAQPTRCGACRCNFASYRKVKQRYRSHQKPEETSETTERSERALISEEAGEG